VLPLSLSILLFFYCYLEQDSVVTLIFTPTKWYQSKVGVFKMAEEKSTIGGVKVELKPFDGRSNFTLWQRKMKNILIQQDLHMCILGVESKPETMTTEAWNKADMKAMSSIELHLSDEVTYNVMEATTAKCTWEKLEKLYMGKTLSNKLFLKDQLYNLRMEEGDDLMEHLNLFNRCINDLLRVEVKYEEEDKALLLLRSLPSSFKHFRTTLMFGKETLRFEEVVQDIISHVKMNKSTSNDLKNEGLLVKGSNERGRSKEKDKGTDNRWRSKSRNRKDVECYYCHKKGHIKKHCRKFKADQKEGKKCENPSTAALTTENKGELFSVSSGKPISDLWILDSGCTFHMCANKHWFDTYEKKDGGEVLMGNNVACKIIGIGTVKIKMYDGIIRTFGNVRHVPALKKNLISLGTLDALGLTYSSGGGKIKICKGSLVVMRGEKLPNNLYKLKGDTISGGAAISTPKSLDEDSAQLWHLRLGHMSERAMEELHKRKLLKNMESCKLDFCKYCVLGKQCKVSFKPTNKENRAKEVLNYIHSDVWGPAPTKSHGGARYFVTFMDDHSRKIWVYFMREKSEVFSKFKEWKAEVENQTGRKIKYLRSDNGGEYRDGRFLEFCKKEGIIRHFTVKKTPQQNGAAERMNRTLMERERCMRLHAGLPESFWAESVNHAAFLVNRSPSKLLDSKCAEEVWSGKDIDYSTLKVFGCKAYVHIPSDERNKLKPKSLECIFLGFEKGVKAYRLWDPKNKKKVLSRDVVFDERLGAEATGKDEVCKENHYTEIPFSTEDSFAENQAEVEPPEEQQQAEEVHEEPMSIAQTRPRRVIKPPQRLGWEDEAFYALLTSEEDPSTFKEALESKERQEWMAAMSEEMTSLHKNSVWELVPKPKDQRIIGSKWIYRKKESLSETEAPTYKARLVAKGFSQIEGIDYDEIFSPVVKHTSIRVLLSLVAQHDMELEQLDVKTAFLHGDLEETIYMTQPEGYVEAGKENHVCRLKKSLYGLKQSPRQWYKRFDSFMLQNGYKRGKYDCCVYLHTFDDGHIIILMLYVDDMLIACRDTSKINKLKEILSSEFDMKDLGAAKKILGMEIKRDRDNMRLYLSQSKYIGKVLEKFHMVNAKPVSTPLAAHFNLSAKQSPSTDDEVQEMKKIPYASAVGCLMYAMVCTRPDLAQAMSVVSKYMSNPGREHWQAVKWIIRYLKGTRNKSIMFERQHDDACITGFVDSDYAGDLDKRRSTTGYVFTCGGGPVSWRSMLQKVSALSTTEAEYMALTEAAKEAIWLKGLASDLGLQQAFVTIQCDSQSAICLAKNQVFHTRSKHIEVRYHRIRDWLNNGEVEVKKVHTDENASDFLTKPVTAEKFKHCLSLLNMKSC